VGDRADVPLGAAFAGELGVGRELVVGEPAVPVVGAVVADAGVVVGVVDADGGAAGGLDHRSSVVGWAGISYYRTELRERTRWLSASAFTLISVRQYHSLVRGRYGGSVEV
jgi:hypothetical protein